MLALADDLRGPLAWSVLVGWLVLAARVAHAALACRRLLADQIQTIT